MMEEQEKDFMSSLKTSISTEHFWGSFERSYIIF